MKVCPKCSKQFPDEANFCPVDAARLVAAAQPASGNSSGRSDLIGGRFEIGERLNKGGSVTGDVYRAIDHQSGNAVCAVKLVAPEVAAAVAQRADRALKQLERVSSPAIAQVLASGKQDDRLWIATELVENARTLSEVIDSSGVMDADDASTIVVAIGEALIEAAKVGVVHRDLAPKNVLVSGDAIKLINFCVPVPSSDKAPGVAEFVAPDVIEGKPVDQRSNIYSLGALYYYMLTARPPFTGGDIASIHNAHLTGTLTPPAALEAVPADIDALVVKSLERNTNKRYLNLRQFLDEIGRVTSGPEGGAGSTAPFGRVGGGKASKKSIAATLMGVGSQNDAKTRQMEVQIPPEALREAAALEQAVAAAAQAQAPQLLSQAPAAGSPWSPPQQGPAGALAAVGSVEVAPAGQTAIMGSHGGHGAMAPAAGAVAAAAPQIGAMAQPAAPHVSSPSMPGAGAGGKKKPVAEDKKASKGKFRETMWFKKGELDVAAAEAAAEERVRSGDDAAADKADTLPIEERYGDDGSLSRADAEKYSLRTGATSMMAAIKDPNDAASSKGISERELIGEMRGGSKKLIIAIVVAVIVIAIAIAVFAS